MSQLFDISQCGGKRRVLAHPPTPGQRVLQRLDRTGEAKNPVPPVDRRNRTLVGSSIASLSAKYGVLSREVGKKRVLAHPLCPGQVGIKRLDRRVAANKLVPPLQRLIRPLVDEIVPMKCGCCKLSLNLYPQNRTTLLSVVNSTDNGTLAHRGFDMPVLVSAKAGITAMVGRPVMRYTPAITGTGLIDVGQPLVGQKRPSGHHPEGATQARGGFTHKHQITNWRFRSVASSRLAIAAPPIDAPTSKVPNWSCTMTYRVAKSCQPNGFSDTQYGMLEIKRETKLMSVERTANKAPVFTVLSASIYSASANRISAISWVYSNTVYKTPNPLTAESHSQRVKKLSTVEFPYRSRVLKITHRSRFVVAATRKEVGNKFYLGNSTTPFFGSSSQIPKALSMVDSLPSVCVRTWQSPSFNAASTANGACHGNSLARESATIFHEIGRYVKGKSPQRGLLS